MTTPPTTSEDFVTAYEAALAAQDWSRVAPLVHDDACVTFSNGAAHRGKDAIRRAFESNFRAIANEVYKISNVHFVRKDPPCAVYLFDFDWTGVIDGQSTSGHGAGTSVLVLEDSAWKLLAEHLGPRP